MTPQRFINVLKRRSLVVWSIIAIGLGLLYSLRNVVPSSFVGVSHVVLVADSGGRDPSVSIVDLPSIATSTVVLERVRNTLALPLSLINLKQNVSANVLGHSSIMAIQFRDQSSERAIAVSNAVSDELSRYYDEISTERYDVNVDRLSSELADESRQLKTIDRQMSGVVSKNPFVVSDKSIDDITEQLALLNAQRAEAQAQLQGDRAIAATLAPNAVLAQTARHEILAGDPAYQAVRTAVAKDTADVATETAGYTGSFPGLPGANAKISAEATDIQRAARRAIADRDAFSQTAATTAAQRQHQLAVVSGDEARIAQLDGLIATEQANLHDVPNTGSTFDELRAKRDAVQTEYTALATRRANALANRAEASSLGSVVVLDRAIKADTQLAGSRARAAVVALILILALAVGGAFLVESLDPRIRRAEEIEELYGFPVVAHFAGQKS
jgi:capsular polysaccharide biosynthesis protein